MKKSEAVDLMTRFSLPGIEKCNIRIYVIKNIEYANKSILNSLLKFVEEPPAGVYAVFTTKNYDAIIPTIRSRCFCFYLEKDEKTVNNFLNSKDISMNEKNLIKKCFYEFEDLKNNFDKVINFLDLIKKLTSSDRLVYANQILSLFRKMEYSDINLFMEICKNAYPSIANKIIQLQDNLNLNSPRVLIYNQIYDLLGEVNK
ncbi:MAG: hypothetical protein MJ223_03110 [Mycoplasmoidaceae bacterium]|nr:hypothetical protein [Mycoplasmoidaceae bacterium]